MFLHPIAVMLESLRKKIEEGSISLIQKQGTLDETIALVRSNEFDPPKGVFNVVFEIPESDYRVQVSYHSKSRRFYIKQWSPFSSKADDFYVRYGARSHKPTWTCSPKEVKSHIFKALRTMMDSYKDYAREQAEKEKEAFVTIFPSIANI